jgi:hypothetical protein
LKPLQLALLLLPFAAILSFGAFVRFGKQLLDGDNRNGLGGGDDIFFASLTVETSSTL